VRIAIAPNGGNWPLASGPSVAEGVDRISCGDAAVEQYRVRNRPRRCRLLANSSEVLLQQTVAAARA